MSDLLSPLLVVMADEGQAYLSFCALMERLKSNFYSDGATITKKFEHLSLGLLHYDPEYYAYLKMHKADDLLYCYRWLLLEMKREFSFPDACMALEVLWASLPPRTRGQAHGVPLYEIRFAKKEGGGFTKKRENIFTNVVTLRKRLSSCEESPKRTSAHHLKYPQRDRIQSAGSAEEQQRSGSQLKKSQSHEGAEGRKVKDLNEFFKLTTEAEKIDSPSVDAEDEDDIDYSGGNMCLQYTKLPPPAVFGDGNPFLMFMCIAILMQHRDYIIDQQLDYQEIAMHFDRMVRRHNVKKTLGIARKMFAEYLNDDWKKEGHFHSRRQQAKTC